METLQTTVSLMDGMAFDAGVEGYHFPIDADPEFGGQGLGPKPKGLLLTALAGCTAMDVIAVLRKMRVEPETFTVEVDGDLADTHPKSFTDIRLVYRFTGDHLPADKLRKAVQLSQERYCGVAETLRSVVPMHSTIVVNGEELSGESAAA